MSIYREHNLFSRQITKAPFLSFNTRILHQGKSGMFREHTACERIYHKNKPGKSQLLLASLG